MQRLVMCGKEERKGRACRWSGFWGDEQITRIDVLIYEQICRNEDLPVTVRRILRADLQKRGFARKASLTQCAGMAWKLLKKSTLIIGRAFDDKKK